MPNEDLRVLPWWREEKNRSAVEALRSRHSRLHPLVFHRTMERATGLGDLFDLLSKPGPLSDDPTKLDPPVKSNPFVWDSKTREWRHTSDIFQTEALLGKEAKEEA